MLELPPAAQLLQQPEADAGVYLQHLVEGGLVEVHGSGRTRTYTLSAAIDRRHGQEAAYVRQRGFDLVQWEQMVLQFVQSHGKITRRQTAELCRVSSRQAAYVLERLVKDGRLRLSGKPPKGADYVEAQP